MSSMTRADGYYASWEEIKADRKLQRELDEKRNLENELKRLKLRQRSQSAKRKH